MDLFAGDSTDDVPARDPATPAVADDTANLFPDVFAFVDDLLVHVYARRHDLSQTFKWCPWWHHHPEAMARLEALWKAFESLRQDPGTGGSNWWNGHADPTMRALTASDGTFRECNDTGHVDPPMLLSHSPKRPTPKGAQS